MIIDYLGHSEVLINIKNSNNENVQILSDAWLSSYSVADLMQRNPIIKLDYENFAPDAVFISHAHMDHFDPYSLIKIFKYHKPVLLLPETLTYLKDILIQYLDCEIKILKNKQTISFKWVNIQGVIFPDWMNTNEADVMTLAVWNDKEIVFSEIDIVPPDSEEGIGYVYQLFTQKDFETRLYLSTRNELEWNLTIIDLPPEDREEFALEYRQKRIWEMYQHYNNILALEDMWIKANIYKLPGFVRGFVGQGIIWPAKKLGCDPLKLQIMSLEENVQLETEVAGDFGLFYPMYALNKVWEKLSDCSYQWLGRYVFEKWDLSQIEKIPFVEWEYFKAIQDLTCNCTRKLKNESIIKAKVEQSDVERIKYYLDTVFLPYQMGRMDANLKNLALENKGLYIIQLKKFENKKQILGYFIWSLWGISSNASYCELFTNGFEFFEWEDLQKILKENQISDEEVVYNETYFVEDLINFLNWKVELYSNFWQYLEPGTNIYLWECLGANYINNEIVKRKMKYHFELAKQGLTSEKVVGDILGWGRSDK